MFKLVGTLALLTVGCSKDSRWDDSRREYCTELDLLSRRTQGELALVADRLQEHASGPPEVLPIACATAERDLSVINARIEGFLTTIHVLARGRPDPQSVEEAGFSLNLGNDALESIDRNVCATEPGKSPADRVREVAGRVRTRFDEGRARCAAIGWKSSLPEDARP